MRTQKDYMMQVKTEGERLARFATELTHDAELPCGWSWDIECTLDCPLRDRADLRYVDEKGNSPKCMFDSHKVGEEERLFLARTWLAVQLMASDLKEKS